MSSDGVCLQSEKALQNTQLSVLQRLCHLRSYSHFIVTIKFKSIYTEIEQSINDYLYPSFPNKHKF